MREGRVLTFACKLTPIFHRRMRCLCNVLLDQVSLVGFCLADSLAVSVRSHNLQGKTLKSVEFMTIMTRQLLKMTVLVYTVVWGIEIMTRINKEV